MGKIKSVFTMATLYLIRNLLNFSSRLLPVFIIIITLLKLSKVLVSLSWYAVIAILLLEVILVIGALSFDSIFFKNKQKNDNNENSNSEETNKSSEISVKNNAFSVLNIAVAFFAFLGIIFVILKLFKAVTWNWIWVLSPLWLSTALVIFILLICLIIFIISALSKNKKIESKENKDNTSIENNSTSSENTNESTTNNTETYNEANNLNKNNTDNNN